jgi:hypothetical protein
VEVSWVSQERRRPIPGFIGGYLIADDAITLEQLDRALEHQLRLAAQGRNLRLGEVLIEMGFVTPVRLERALKRQAADQEKRRASAKAHAAKGRLAQKKRRTRK